MAIIYNAASVFVHPATEDNLPNVVAESLMCGIPVAGFSIGGMPEMVNEENGFLADNVTPAALLDAIHKALILSPKKQEISQSAADQFSPEKQAREFMALARTMV